MQIKKLAYLKVKVVDSCREFCELYTFLKPTTLYLPHNLIVNVDIIDKNKICLIITSENNKELHEKVVLSLCESNTKKIVITCQPCKVVLYLKLCEINTLKPCYHHCCNEEESIIEYNKNDCEFDF